MTDKMIVPMGVIGGNQIEMVNPRLAGKVRITNPEGKVKTLSVDEFQKQVIANQDKIKDGEDVEFKSDNGKKALKIGAAVLGTAAVVAGVIYRKDIAKYIKNFTWKGFKEDIKGLGRKIKNLGKKVKNKIFGNSDLKEKRYAKCSVGKVKNDLHRHYAQTYESNILSKEARAKMIEDAKAAFRFYDAEAAMASLGK